ncbi:MAG TPA: efflux RND transporter permease subunit, partial [Planctomycetota bacterium]|nr:efflux RND transporter permease subunit [Planctomycetota bacterium]
MIRFFAAHPTAANLMMLMFIILGITALPHLQRETFPRFADEQVEVRVVYPGATATDVEEAVCRRIEDAIEGVNYVDEVLSEAREGVGVVTVTLQEGADFQAFWDDIRTEVEAIDDFPQITEKPVIRKLNRTDRVVSVAVTGPMSVTDLKAYCQEMKERMQAPGKISNVAVLGFSEHQIRIELSTLSLMQSGLSVAEIAGMIARQSVDLPAGAIETRDRDILIRFTDERRIVQEFADLVVLAGPSGGEIRLGDIARITDRFELDEAKVVFNGRRAGLLEVTKTRTEDILTVYDAVVAFVERERRTAPPGVELALTNDVSSLVRDRLDMLSRNGWQGLLLVFLVMWLFFSFRFSFWVAMGLPVSFLGAFFLMPLLGYSVNMITMVALLLGIGLLMDDAIVIAENVAVHVRRGEDLLKAVVEGTREVRMGVLFSYLTTVVVFVQLAFLEGSIGRVMRLMPLILILVLTVSLIEAFLILPHHLLHSMEKHDARRRGRVRRRLEAGIDWVRGKLFGTVISKAVDWRYFTVGLAALAVAVSVSLYPGGVLKFQAFPDLEGNVVQARILLPQGTPLWRCEQVARRVTDALDRVNARFKPLQPDGRDLVRNVFVQYGVNPDAYEAGPHVATLSVDLLSTEERRGATIDDIINLWRRETGVMSDLISLRFAEPMLGPQGRPIDVTIEGDDLSELHAGAREVVTWLDGFAGVHDLAQDLRPGKPEVRVRLSEGATTLGLDAQAVAMQLRAAFYGTTASEIQVGRESYEIDVRLAPDEQDSLGDLEYFHVTLPDGSQAPLGAVAHLAPGRSWARIARLDRRRAVRIHGDVDTRRANTSDILRRFRTEFVPQLQRDHPSLHVVYKGEVKESAKTYRSIQWGFIFGLTGIYLLLSFQFRSYIEPIIVMLAIP